MAFELTNFVSHARACSILRNLVISRRGPGGVFLLPANVCPVVPLTLLTARQPFEFIDVDRNDLSMDRALVNRRLECPEPYVAGIIYVRSYGFLADISDSFSSWRSRIGSADCRRSLLVTARGRGCQSRGCRRDSVQHRLRQVCGLGVRGICLLGTRHSVRRNESWFCPWTRCAGRCFPKGRYRHGQTRHRVGRRECVAE